MAHSFTFTVTVEVERMEGKFAARDEIADALTEAIEDGIGSAGLDGIGADGDSVYEVTDSSIDLMDPKPYARRQRVR